MATQHNHHHQEPTAEAFNNNMVAPSPNNHGIQEHHQTVHRTSSSSISGNEKAQLPPDYSDQEKGRAAGAVHDHTSSSTTQDGTPTKQPPRWAESGAGAVIYRYRWHLLRGFTFCLFTGWWIASLILHRKDKNWVIPFLVWFAITFRIVTRYVSVKYISTPIKWAWTNTAVRIYDVVPEKFRSLAGSLLVIVIMCIGSFVSKESADNTRANRAVSLFGMVFIIFCFWATSRHRKAVNWRTVSGGMLAQYIIGLFVLRTGVGYSIFSFIAGRASDLLGFARDGVAFLTSPDVAATPNFFFSVIPAIIFFISLVQVLYYIGFLQWAIVKLASFVFWALNVSGAEAVVAAATPFIGQGESAMLVRPFVPHMTKAEIHQIMTCGFATISGSVLVGYIGLGINPQALVSSCIMSIPASLALSKLRYPEVEQTLTDGKVVVPDDENKSENVLHAFAQGAMLGIKIAGTIIAGLLCIIAFVALINGLLSWWGRYLNINDPLTLQLIFGYLFFPVAFLLGVSRDGVSKDGGDLLRVGKLLAEKVIVNEYAAFTTLASPAYEVLTPRSKLIATYAVCGFGNISSMGIQIGILSQIAPSRGGDVSRLAFSALITGVFATLTSAAVAGLVLTEQRNSPLAS